MSSETVNTDKVEVKKRASDTALEITKAIRRDWGGMRVYSRIKGINENTLRRVVYGYSTSKPMATILIEDGYLKDAADLKRVPVEDSKE